ncbi:MAG: hypothetical protein ACHBN1_03600 [Heteroscytonema crispum UTEX LB 1556]
MEKGERERGTRRRLWGVGGDKGDKGRRVWEEGDKVKRRFLTFPFSL